MPLKIPSFEEMEKEALDNLSRLWGPHISNTEPGPLVTSVVRAVLKPMYDQLKQIEAVVNEKEA